jgi:hypothetical protein
MLLDDVATYLAANLTKQIMLDATPIPETLAVLYETPGAPNEYTFSTSTGSANVDAESPGLQLLSRAASYQTARNRAEAAYTILDGLSEQTLPTGTGVRYREIVAVAPPFYLQRDDNERYIVAVNFNVKKAVG